MPAHRERLKAMLSSAQLTEAEYNTLVTLLDEFIDTVGEDESHPLASLIEVISILIERYEDEHVPTL
ncbi:MAG: hypothetical protein ABI947_01055 [Chloroflexota bacterium]